MSASDPSQMDGPRNNADRTAASVDQSSHTKRDLLKRLSSQVLHRTYGSKENILSLLRRSDLNTDYISLEGTNSGALWSNLLDTLDAWQLSKVVKQVMDELAGGPAVELCSVILSELVAETEQQTAEAGQLAIITALDRLWEELDNAPIYLNLLLLPRHPEAAQLGGVREWLKKILDHLAAARAASARGGRGDEQAQLADIEDRLSGVVDEFHLYSDLLIRHRSAEERWVGEPHESRSLRAVAEDERILLGCRKTLRSAITHLQEAKPQ